MAKRSAKRTVKFKTFVLVIILQSVVFFTSLALLFGYTSVRTSDWDNPRELAYFIQNALENLSKPAATTPEVSAYQYIPEARLRFVNGDEHKLEYIYADFEDEPENTHIEITTSYVKDNAILQLRMHQEVDDLLATVPAAQNCTRLFVITYTEQPAYFDNFELRATVNTSKENIYVWENRNELCRAATDNVELMGGLLQVLQSAKSY